MTPTPDITPWPAPPAASDAPALLFGGSFDPPHRAHADLALAARDRVFAGQPQSADPWLVVVPAARSPHKSKGPVAPDADRLEMLRRAFAGCERVAVWTDELDRAHQPGGPSYWIDTLERAAVARGSLESVRFLIGADQAAAFHRWHRAADILAACEPVVIPRGDIATRADLLAAVPPAERDDWDRRFINLPLRPESSTRVRTKKHADDLHPAVAAYIIERGLYSD